MLERRPDTRERNRYFPFDPYGVRAVVLSHARIDSHAPFHAPENVKRCGEALAEVELNQVPGAPADLL